MAEVMERHEPESQERREVELKIITIHVNEKPVKMRGPHQTGLTIKQAAIAQHVQIKLDFVLSLEREHGQPAKIIGDTDPVTITEHSRFTAVDNDDNS